MFRKFMCAALAACVLVILQNKPAICSAPSEEVVRFRRVVTHFNAIVIDFFAAIRHGDLSVATFVLKNFKNAHSLTAEDDLNPIQLATLYGHTAIVEEILKHHPEQITDHSPEYGSLLDIAVSSGHEETALFLLNRLNYFIDIKDENGLNSFHLAVSINLTKFVDACLKLRPHFAYGNTMCSALEAAFAESNYGTLTVLQEHYNGYIIPEEWLTPIHILVYMARKPHKISLEKHIAAISEVAYNNWELLHARTTAYSEELGVRGRQLSPLEMAEHIMTTFAPDSVNRALFNIFLIEIREIYKTYDAPVVDLEAVD